MLLGLIVLVAGANPHLDEGRRLSKSLHYPEAVRKLKLAVEVPSSTREERREAYDLLARALLALGEADKAREAYAGLLERDPHAPRPEGGPKILAAFDEAKLKLYPRDFVSLKLAPAPPGWLHVECVDPWGLVQHVQLWSARGEQPFSGEALELDEHLARAKLPELQPTERLRWYVEAAGENGKPLASLGARYEPMTVTAPEVSAAAAAAPPPVVVLEAPRASRPPRWVGWLLMGLAVAAAGTGAAFAGGADTDAQAARTTRWAADKILYDDRAARRALAANVLFGAGAAFGVGAVFLIGFGE